MADRHSTRIRQTLKGLFSDQWLDSLARSTGFVERQRKVNPVAFFWTLVLGFGSGRTRNLSGFRRAYERAGGVTLVPSSFYDRFNRKLVAFLRAALEHALDEFRLSFQTLGDRFSIFEDILIADATLMKVHAALAKKFPGPRTNSAPASVKLHAVLSVSGKGKSTIKLTSGRVHDRKKLIIGDWVRNRLLLFDLGYYHFQLFRNITSRGGHFLTRAKENANPKILTVFGGSTADEKQLVGKRLQDVLGRLRRGTLDVEVEIRAKARQYNGKQSSRRERVRLVAVKNAKTRKYHAYLTSIPANALSAEEMASAYRARWEIELVFKELKSGYRIDELKSARREVVESLIYAALLTLLVSRRLLRAIALESKQILERITTGRWWTIFSEYAHELQRLVVRPAQHSPPLRDLVKTIRHEIVDPHTTRRPLLVEAL